MAKRAPSSTPKTTRSNKRSTSVPGTYRGFSLQANRFLVHLMKSELTDTISLEAFEDVGVESSTGVKTAEQSKSFLSQNPVADRSLQLWKTLANWVDAAKNGTLVPATTFFVLYSFNPRLGTVARLLNDANDFASATAALSNIRNHLGYPDALSDSDEIRKYILAVLDAPSNIISAIIARFSIESGSIVGIDEIAKLFGSQLIGPESQEDTINWAHGWVKTRIDAQVAQNKPCFITRNEFHDALVNYVRHHDRLTILKSFAGDPDESQIELEIAFRRYVRQLRCISLDDVDVLSAVNDYLRAVVDRTKWSEEGYVNATALDDLAAELIATWRNKQRRVSVMHSSHSEENRGQLLYTDCIEHIAKLDGLDTPQHFIRGSWHALADEIAVGWHPRFEVLLANQPGADGDNQGESTL